MIGPHIPILASDWLMLQSRSWSVPLVASLVFSVSVYVLFNLGLAYLRINAGVLNFFSGKDNVTVEYLRYIIFLILN